MSRKPCTSQTTSLNNLGDDAIYKYKYNELPVGLFRYCNTFHVSHVSTITVTFKVSLNKHVEYAFTDCCSLFSLGFEVYIKSMEIEKTVEIRSFKYKFRIRRCVYGIVQQIIV
jgi:hypothetical protein